MTEAQVLALINQFIIANNNEEITADVLRPILEAMVEQPNDVTGALDDLSTDDTSNLVAAINEVLQKAETNEGITIHYGTGTPDQTPPATFEITDYYVQESGSTVLGMWQWNGNEWAVIANISNNAVLTIPQILTEAQKKQARVNIGADYFYDTAETGFSTDLSNFTSLTEKFYFLRISGEGDTVYFASKETNTEDFVGSRIFISATGTKHDLGSPTVTQNGYHFWDIGVLPVTINPSTEDWAFQAWINREKFDLQKVTDKGNKTTNNVVVVSGGVSRNFSIEDPSGNTLIQMRSIFNGASFFWVSTRDGSGALVQSLQLYTDKIDTLNLGTFNFPDKQGANETFAMLSDLVDFANDDDVLHDTGEPDKVAMKDDTGKALLDFKSDWNETNVNSVKHIDNKPEETNFSVYNQYSEVVINTTSETELITADTGVLNIANLNEGASYIGSLTGLFASGAVDGQTLTFRIGIGNRSVLTQAINTGTQTGDLPVKVDYTINFVSNQIARITMFIQVGTESVATVQETANTINVGNDFDFTLQLSGQTFTTYSSYLHKHVQ